MKRLAMWASLALLFVSSCGSTMVVRGTAPSAFNDAATCGVTPIQIPMGPGTPVVRIHAQTTGREDSVAVAPGAPFAFTWSLPAGTYAVRVWASIPGFPDEGCDTTVVRTLIAKPDRPRVSP
jgi:hypothetical protein